MALRPLIQPMILSIADAREGEAGPLPAEVPVKLIKAFPAADGADEPEALVQHFLRSLQVLLRSARLYQRNHPSLTESLDVAGRNMRAMLDVLGPVTIEFEPGRITVPRISESRLPDPRSELAGLADDLKQAGVTALAILKETNVGELDTLVQLLNRALLRSDAGANGQPARGTPSGRSGSSSTTSKGFW